MHLLFLTPLHTTRIKQTTLRAYLFTRLFDKFRIFVHSRHFDVLRTRATTTGLGLGGNLKTKNKVRFPNFRIKTNSDFRKTNSDFQKTNSDFRKTNSNFRKKQTPIFETQTPISEKQTPIFEKQTPISEKQTPIFKTQTPISEK